MNITIESIMNAWLPISVFYFVYFILCPMLAMSGNRWINKATGAEKRKRYWQGVRWASGMFHIAAVLAGLLLWVLHPYMFPAQ